MGRAARSGNRPAVADRHGERQGAAPRSWVRASRRWRSLVPILTTLAAAAVLTLPTALGAQASRAWNATPYPLGSVPVVLQSQRNDCGPAVVATLAAWSGSRLELASVTAAARLAPDGLSLGEFARLADRFGFPGTWYRVGPADLAGLPLPFVAHMNVVGSAPLGHLVAVRAVTRGAVTVADPAVGAYVLPLDAFARRFSGRVFLLGAL